MRSLFLFLLILSTLSSLAFSSQDLDTAYVKEAKKCADLSCVRRGIDEINNDIIDLLVRRTAYVRRAGDFKIHRKIANDQKRVDDIIRTITKKSEMVGLPK